ncbi:MAG: hypothetical protein ACRDG2_01570 [Actinomycetota bacterium]
MAFSVAFAGAVVLIRAFEGGDFRPVTPSGSARIVFSGGEQQIDLFSMNPDGSDVRRLTDSPASEEEPAWSPDGSRIAFAIREPEDTTSYVIGAMDSDGSNKVEIAATRLEPRTPVTYPSWSPDGTEIAFAAYGDGGGIYVAPLGGGAVRRLTTAGPPRTHVDSEPRGAPDGTSIVFVRWILGSEEANEYQIVQVAADGGDPMVLARFAPGDVAGEEVRGISWSPDGTRLAFTTRGSIHLLDPATGETREIVACEALGCEDTTDVFTNSTSWSPDGRRISFSAWTKLPNGASAADPPVIHVATLSGDEVSIASTGVEGLFPAWQPVNAQQMTPGPTPDSETLRAEIAATIRVGEDVRSVIYGARSVWVAVSNNDGTFAGRILRVDPATNDIVAEIPVETIPTWEVGGGAMVVEGDNLWITGGVEAPGGFGSLGGGSDAAVTRIDVATNEVTDVFTLGGDVGADLAFLDGDLWVLLFGDESVDNSMEVVRVDPETGAVLTRIPLSSRWAHTLVPADGRLVVYEGGNGAVNIDGHLTSIDPAAGVTTKVDVPSGYFEGGPVVWRGELWFAWDRGFARFDPASNTVTGGGQALDPTRYALCCGLVEADDRRIWFLGYDGLQVEGPVRLTLFGPTTDAVTELVTLGDENPVAMAVAPDSVWILNYEGTLTKVDLNQG